VDLGERNVEAGEVDADALVPAVHGEPDVRGGDVQLHLVRGEPKRGAPRLEVRRGLHLQVEPGRVAVLGHRLVDRDVRDGQLGMPLDQVVQSLNGGELVAALAGQLGGFGSLSGHGDLCFL
jgi:hypothetical protein